MFKSIIKKLILFIGIAAFLLSFIFVYFTINHKDNIPKVSVIVPVYNGEKYLPRSSACLTNQTFKDFEVIYVNDGSTDGTKEFLENLQKKYKNIRVINQENQGAGGARNTGLAAAKGDYVIFLDVDDVYDKNMLKIMYKKAKKKDADITLCGYIYKMSSRMFTNAGDIAKRFTNLDPFNWKDIPDYIFAITTSCVWDKMYKRDFLLQNNIIFPNLKHGEDVYFVNKTLILANKITAVKNVLIEYHANNAGSLSMRVNQSPNDSIEAWFLTKDFLIEKNLYDELKMAYLDAIMSSFIWTFERLDENNRKIFVKKYRQMIEKEILSKSVKYYIHRRNYDILESIMYKYE